MPKYQTALITGASSGIGACFAEALARQGSDLILVARSEDKMREQAKRLRAEFGGRVEVVAADLARVQPAAAVKAAVDALGLRVDLLINNAGFGSTGAFVEQDAERDSREILLNSGAVVDMAHAFLPPMLIARHGAILNVASSAAFQPMPYFAVYAATKAFVYSFSDALAMESRPHGVHVMSVCPGPVDTPFVPAAGLSERRRAMLKRTMITPEQVVVEALRGLVAGRRLVLPGTQNKISSAFARSLPRALITAIAGQLAKG